MDNEVEPKDWSHPADSVKINKQKEGNEHTIQIFTVGSQNENGLGSGTAIYLENKLIHQIKHKIHDRCSNNQAEQMPIVKALPAIETIKLKKNFPRTILINIGSRITLDSLTNKKNRNCLIE